MWRNLTITLPYNWAYMATMVVGTDIFLCGGPMDRDQGEWATRVLMKFCPNTMEVSRMSIMREHGNYKQGRGAGQWTGLRTPRRRWRKESAARLSDMASEEESRSACP
jgi:hypothetical protein